MGTFGGKLLILGFGVMLVAILVILVYWLRGGKPEDLMLERKKQWIEEAKKNKHPDMVQIFLTHTPSMKSYIRRMDEALQNITPSTKTAEQLTKLIKETKELNQRITEKRSPILYGEITGWVTEDILTNIQDFYLRNREKIDPDERHELEKMLDHTGRVFHIFTYRKAGWFGSNIGASEEMVIAPDEQVTGVGSIDGVIILHGLGTRRIGRHFSILTGDPAAIDLFRTHVTSLSRIDVALQQEGSIGELVQRAVDSDAPSMKAVEMIRATQPPRIQEAPK